MRRQNLKIQILITYITGFALTECRKYDVNLECVKLYGEDLPTILRRFRKSPEYLAILNEMVTQYKLQLDDMTIQIQYGYLESLPKRVNKTLMEHDHDRTLNKRASLRSSPLRFALRNKDSSNESAHNAIDTLDSYGPLTSSFSAMERNLFRDAGFEVAGNAIHKLIDSMGDDNEEEDRRSTLGPESKVITTTEHVTIHQVTTTKTTTAFDTSTIKPNINRSKTGKKLVHNIANDDKDTGKKR